MSDLYEKVAFSHASPEEVLEASRVRYIDHLVMGPRALVESNAPNGIVFRAGDRQLIEAAGRLSNAILCHSMGEPITPYPADVLDR